MYVYALNFCEHVFLIKGVLRVNFDIVFSSQMIIYDILMSLHPFILVCEARNCCNRRFNLRDDKGGEAGGWAIDSFENIEVGGKAYFCPQKISLKI